MRLLGAFFLGIEKLFDTIFTVSIVFLTLNIYEPNKYGSLFSWSIIMGVSILGGIFFGVLGKTFKELSKKESKKKDGGDGKTSIMDRPFRWN